MSDKKILIHILILFLGWKALLLLVTYFGLSTIPHMTGAGEASFPYKDLDYWIRWSNWDGGHFRGIAEVGYLPIQAAFFPLYPLLIKALMFLGIQSLIGGQIISTVSAIGALFFLYKLVLLDHDEDISKKTIFLFLAFPTSFYLTAIYSESLFLLLTILAFYFARKKNWALSFLFASLSASTRLIGAGVIFCIALEYFLKNLDPLNLKKLWTSRINRIIIYLFLTIFLYNLFKLFFTGRLNYTALAVVETVSIFLRNISLSLLAASILYRSFSKVNFKKIPTMPTLYLILSFIPFIFYILFLKLTTGDLLAFINVEKHWHRTNTFPWEAPIAYLNSISANHFFQTGGNTQAVIELAFLIFFLIMLILSFKKLRLSYSIYFLLGLLIPLSSGTLIAIHRYALVLFPLILTIALIKNEYFQKLWLIFSLMFLGIFAVLFINSYWVT